MTLEFMQDKQKADIIPAKILPVVLAVAAGLVLGASPARAQMTVLVEESFGGDGSNPLHESDADTFSPAIVAAGGSATWLAEENHLDDGSVSTTNGSASLNLGSYIDDAKGTAAGYFELTATISETTGTWLSLGFSILNEPAVTQVPGSPANFTSNGTDGIGTILYRASGELDMFIGPQTAGGQDGPDGNSGARTLTVALDFRPAVYDGVASFGTVTWTDSALGDVNNLGTAFALPDQGFGSILLSAAENSAGTYSGLTLSQISTGGDTFADWISGFGLDLGQQGFDFDADGDGLDNGVEGWFGTDPGTGNVGLAQVGRSGNEVSFQHPVADPALTDITGSYEWSLDLSNWNAPGATAGGVTVELGSTTAGGTATVTATISAGDPAQLFVRAVAVRD